MARNSNSGTGSKDRAPALSTDEVAELLDQSRAGAVEALEPRRLGRLTRQLQAARDQARAADDQPQVKDLAAALRRVKAETARREDGEDDSAESGKSVGTKGGKGKDAAGQPLKAPKARPATPAELPPLPPGAVPLAEGEASRSNLPPVRQPASTGMTSPGGADRKQQKAADKAERQRVKEAEKAERKRVKEAEKAEKKAERKAARKAEKAAAKG